MERNSLLSTLQLTNKTYDNSKTYIWIIFRTRYNQLNINNLTEEQILEVSEKLTVLVKMEGPL